VHVEAGYPRRNLHGHVVHTIGGRIVRGLIKPGEALSSEDLSASLGMSRTVLREAIKVLAAKGLVESRPKTGTRVRPRSAWNLLDADVLGWQRGTKLDERFLRQLTEVRRIVEPAAAELAAQRATTRDLAAIDEAYRRMETALARSSPLDDDFVEADKRFHTAILAACRNDLLERMCRVVYSGLDVSFRTTNRLPGRAEQAMPKHRAIVNAIRRRDAAGAGEAMRQLVQRVAAEIDHALRKRAPR
jgi:GntR family galactonate operon transcriptional repressor